MKELSNCKNAPKLTTDALATVEILMDKKKPG